MAQSETLETKGVFGGLIEMPQHQVMQIAILGVALGFMAWLLGLLVKHAILMPLFCGDPSSSICTGIDDISANSAAVLAAVAGLMGLVRLSVYRPLLIVLATLISFWGIGSWTSGLQWYETVAWFIILYALGYIAFSWLVRPRSFAPTAVLIVVAVVLIRFLPTL